MLIIRAAQLDAIARERREQLVGRIVAEVKRHYWLDYERLGEAGLTERVRTRIEQSAQYGIRSERDVQGWVSLAFRLGEGFEEEPARAWVLRILRDDAMSAAEKLQLISRTL